jgi:DNA processing protein
VGTRTPDPEAFEFARDLAFELGQAGCVVLSGGARGVDAAAHQGALDAGAPTVAVLATGLTSAYPPTHGPLFGRIAEQGALLTESDDDAAPHAFLFLRRNAVLAALAKVVVVVQAPVRSGALSTAAHARRLGRVVLAVPWAPFDVRGRGGVGLLRGGAGVCTSSKDVLSVPALGAEIPTRGRARRTRKSNDHNVLDDDGEAIAAVLGPRPRHVDELASRAKLPPERAQRALLTLLLLGLAEERDPGRYTCRTTRAPP